MKKLLLILPILIFYFNYKSFCQTDVAGKSCTDCHANLIKQPVVHAAAEDACDNCHVPNGDKHPQAGVKGFSLSEKMPDLCFICHDENTKKHIHPPAEEGECLICHSPHGSANKSLLVNAPPSALCAECHDLDMTNKRIKHKPVEEGNCQLCHDPHQSDFANYLKEEKPKLCMDCHAKVKLEAGLKNLHPPFDDDCANCHETHSSDEKELLISKMPGLCFECHDEIQAKIENSSVVHGIINDAKGCANCHSPHASNFDKFLLREEKELCLECHNKTIKTQTRTIPNINKMLKKGNSVHGAIENDGCVVCHNPHASNNPLLLVEPFPSGRYTNGNSEDFELCFSCHDSGLMDNEYGTTDTNFRNGNENLHFFHLKGANARNCNLCHNVHGSVNEHLIADKVRFGNWEMPVKFKVEGNGGSCNTGCHAERKYSRDAPNVVKPKPVRRTTLTARKPLSIPKKTDTLSGKGASVETPAARKAGTTREKPAAKKTPKYNVPQPDIKGVNYRVQFYTSIKPVNINKRMVDVVAKFSKYGIINQPENNLYKYQVGPFTNKREGKKIFESLKAMGYQVMLLEYNDNRRVRILLP